MSYSPKRKAAFRSKFFRKQQFQAASYVPLAGAVVMLVFGSRYGEEFGLEPQTMVLGTAVLVLTGAGFSWLNWRCPACRKYLGIGLNPSQCPKCKLPLGSQ